MKIPNAATARFAAEKYQKEECIRVMGIISRRIRFAACSGKMSLIESGYLEADVKAELRFLGYEIDETMLPNKTVICW